MTFEMAAPPLPGDQVGDYVLEEMIGVGGMATVYRASSAQHGQVAVKILHPGKSHTEEARRFRREFLTLRELRHPGVVQVYEAGVHGDYPWIAMELVKGTDLATLAERWQTAPPKDRFAQAERIVRGLSEALSYVHSKGLIHRDIKPSNVLLTRDGQPKLTDFGVVKATRGLFTTQLTMAGKLVGTVAFMAPEQITGDTVDARVDLYSLGAVFYELLTGARPIVADSIASYLARHLTENPRLPSDVDPTVPPRLEQVCMRLLNKDPAQRYPSAHHVLAALDANEGPRRRPLHGRDGEMARLLARLDALRDGAGGIVLVHGGQGYGKSALATELVEQARTLGFSVATCSGAAADPLEALCAQLPSSAPQDGQLPVALRIAARTRGHPWTLVIDDVDRLPEAQLAWLTALVRDKVAIEGEPLLLLVTATRRTGPAAAFLTGAATGLTPDQLDLEGLDRRSTVALVRDLGVGGAAGAAVGNRLYEELGGRPGAVEEQVAALLRAGWLAVDPNGEGLRPTRGIDALRDDPLPVPDRIRSQEQERLARLDETTRLAFDALAVLGMEVPPELVGRVSGLDTPQVAEALATLENREMVRRWVEGVQEVVALVSARQRDLAYGLVDPSRRAELHRAAARALRDGSRRRLGPMAEVIARHLLHGGQLSEAYPMLIDAARRQARAGHAEQAYKLVRQALDARPAAEPDLGPEEAQRLRRALYTLEGEVLEQCGDLTGATSAWERAVAAARAEGDDSALLRARAGLGLVQAALGHTTLAAEGLEQALRALPRGDPMWARVAQALATTRLLRGNAHGASELWQQLVLHAREAGGAEPMEAEAEAGLALVDLVRGRLVDGRRKLDRAELRLREGGRADVRLTASLYLAELALSDGRLIEAGERSSEAERLAWEVPRVVACIRALGLAALARHARGDEDEARRLAHEAAALQRTRSDTGTALEVVSVVPVARALCEVGDVAAAVDLLPQGPLADASGLDDPNGLLQAVQARAWASRDRARGTGLAQQALLRPPALLPWCAARIALDAGIALEMADSDQVGWAVDKALAATAAAGMRLLRLEALLLAERVGRRDLLAERTALRDEFLRDLGRPANFSAWWT